MICAAVFANLLAPLSENSTVVFGREVRNTELTVYNGFGLVKELQTLTFSSGEVEVEYSGLPESVDPTSVIFTDLTFLQPIW